MIYGKHVKVSLKHHWEIASIIRCYGALKMIYRNCGIHTSYILIDFLNATCKRPLFDLTLLKLT